MVVQVSPSGLIICGWNSSSLHDESRWNPLKPGKTHLNPVKPCSLQHDHTWQPTKKTLWTRSPPSKQQPAEETQQICQFSFGLLQPEQPAMAHTRKYARQDGRQTHPYPPSPLTVRRGVSSQQPAEQKQVGSSCSPPQHQHLPNITSTSNQNQLHAALLQSRRARGTHRDRHPQIFLLFFLSSFFNCTESNCQLKLKK